MHLGCCAIPPVVASSIMEEENPFLKKKPAAPAPAPALAAAAEAHRDVAYEDFSAPAAAAEPEPLYEETADPNENPFAKKAPSRQTSSRTPSRAPSRAASTRHSTNPDDVAVDVIDGGGNTQSPASVPAPAPDENPFAQRKSIKPQAVADNSSSVPHARGGSGGKCSVWECCGFRGASDRKVPPPDYTPSCAPVKNPNPELRAWLAEERRRSILSALFVVLTPVANWAILIYMLASNDDSLYNSSLIIPRNSSVTVFTAILNPFVTNPANWWNQVVDTVGFVSLGYMLVLSVGPHRIQLAVLIYLILIPLSSLLSLGIELDIQAPVYGNQSILFGFIGVIFAYVIVIKSNRCRHLTIALVMAGVYFGIYVGIRFAVGDQGDPVQWLTPVVMVGFPLVPRLRLLDCFAQHSPPGSG